MSLHENWTDVNQKELFKSLLSQPRTTRSISEDTVQKNKEINGVCELFKNER